MYKKHDEIACNVIHNTIVSKSAKDIDVTLRLLVIGTEDEKCVVLIPPYLSIRGSWVIKEEHIDRYSIDPDHLDCKAIALGSDRIVSTQPSLAEDGMFCKTCREFFPMAQPNQSDGSLRCWSCRNDPWR